MPQNLASFFAPQGVALIGASPRRDKISYGVLRNLLQHGYQGYVYPVNPRYQDIDGLTCYPDIAGVPDPVDLAVTILPAKLTPGILEACGQRGLKGVVIVSGGFKETGPDGATIEAECLTIAKKYNLRLIGPNCVGTMDSHTGLNTTFIEGMPEPGHIAFLSQSGGVCAGIIDYIKGQHIGFSRFVSLGNEADITETDMIEYLADDLNTRVIAVYVEGITHGARFMQVARRVTRHKPIVLLKGGRTEAGTRAVSSHTGSIAGSEAAYDAAFHQSGIIEVDSIHALFDVSVALAYQPLPAGNRVLVLSNSGGPAALAADNLASRGMMLPQLTPATADILKTRLDPVAQIDNPTDMLGGAGPDEYAFVIPHLLADPNVDAVLVTTVPHILLKGEDVATKVCQVAARATKPVIACFVGDQSVAEARQILHQHHLPMYTFPETASHALQAMWQYAQWRQHPLLEASVQIDTNPQKVKQILSKTNGNQTLGEADTRPMFAAYHIPVIAGHVAHTPAEAAKIADNLGYPVVLKIISPDILHKSDAGGILLNLNHAAAVTTAYQNLLQNVKTIHPSARLEGVLVEAMAPPGTEVIVGMRRDPQFGPLMMFGLGGIYVELLSDVSFRVAPISREEALAMVRETKAGQLLAGQRGQQPADINAVADCIMHLSQLALDFPQIQEVEVNPLLVLPQGQGAIALDGRAILAKN
jgi:acetyltransferase